MLNNVTISGRARKYGSEMVIENTFSRDPEYQIGYLYDASHDLGEERLKFRGLHPYDDENKIPIELKLQAHTLQTYDKSQITYHIQFKPSQECNVPYYDEVFAERYHAQWPVGLYLDLMDSKERYNRWLVVGRADVYNFAFPTYDVLPCDKVFQWIHNRKRYQCVGVQRTQNSYSCAFHSGNSMSKVL